VSDASHRQDPRIPLNVTVSRADDVEPGRYVAVDISCGGICMRSMRKEKVGGFVALSFSLDGHDLHLYAEVIWSRTDGTADAIAPHLVGMKWVTPSTSAAQVIRSYVAQRLAETTPG
jgi:c-di-GMP-binding flagellar brake protein YcgR